MAPSRPLTVATHAVHADMIAALCRRGEVDVCEPPPSPEALAPELLGHPRSVFTPHLGSAVAEVRRDIEMRAARKYSPGARR